MPSQRYKDRYKVCVPLKSTPTVVYGFNTNILSAEGSELGHAEITPAQIAIFGTKRPRPQRVQKIDPGSNQTTSWADGNKTRAGLVSAGWKVISREVPMMQGRNSQAARKTELVRVEITTGIFYAWDQPKEVRAKLNDAGIGAALPELVGPSDRVFAPGTDFYQGGESLIKPVRVEKTSISGSEVDTCSTWIDFNKAVPDGWNVSL